MLSDERIAEIAETHIGRLKDIGHKSGLVIRTDAELACESAIRAALTEQAETHALELRAYEATVQNLEQRIRDLQLEMLAYGNHRHDCGALSEQACTCGLSAAVWG